MQATAKMVCDLKGVEDKPLYGYDFVRITDGHGWRRVDIYWKDGEVIVNSDFGQAMAITLESGNQIRIVLPE